MLFAMTYRGHPTSSSLSVLPLHPKRVIPRDYQRVLPKTLSKAERRVEQPLWFSRFAAYLIIGGGKTGKTVFPPGFPSGKYLGIPKEMPISELFVEITQKRENGFPGQGWENRLALPEHLLTPVYPNIVIRSFPHHNPIFREVVNLFGLNAITMRFSAAVCGRNCREMALDETVPFNPSKRARQWIEPSPPIRASTFTAYDRTTLRPHLSDTPPCSTQLFALLQTTLRLTLMQVRRRVSSSKAESLSEQGGESRRTRRRAAARPSSDRFLLLPQSLTCRNRGNSAQNEIGPKSGFPVLIRPQSAFRPMFSGFW